MMQHAHPSAARDALPLHTDNSHHSKQNKPFVSSWAWYLGVVSCSLALIACGPKEQATAAPASAQPAAAQTAATPAAQPMKDYDRAAHDPIHFKPAIDSATDEQCLACHKEVLEPSVRAASPAGVKSSEVKAWYQELSTYTGDQETFHRRHIVTPYAKQVMDLKCNTCHQGNNPREEAPGSSADTVNDDLRLRKQVDAGAVCLMCHGKMNYEVMGLPEPWQKSKTLFNNDCLLCHAAIRTTRHHVNFLKANAIEEAAKGNGDVCFGCHGGRAWYQTNFPYPRHPWPGSGTDVPDWAKDRPTSSLPRFLTGMPPLPAAAAETTTAAPAAADSGAKQ